jgi:chemotaxis signal transduction protein
LGNSSTVENRVLAILVDFVEGVLQIARSIVHAMPHESGTIAKLAWPQNAQLHHRAEGAAVFG